MKKIVTLCVLLAMLICSLVALSACDKVKIELAEFSYVGGDKSIQCDYAIIEMLDGTSLRLDLEGFQYVSMANKFTGGQVAMDYVDYQYRLYGKDGIGYIVSSRNCILVDDPELQVNLTTADTDWDNYSCSEAYVRFPGNEIVMLDSSEIDTAVLTYIRDKNGKAYISDPEDMIIKFTYTKD